MYSNSELYSSIDLKKTFQVMNFFYKGRTLKVCSSLILAQNSNDTYNFYRSIGLCDEENNRIIYDLLSENFIQFIDLKKDYQLINNHLVHECIRKHHLNNLRKCLTNSNEQKDDIESDLDRLPVLLSRPVKKIYAIAVDNRPYISDIYLPISLPSVKYIGGTLFFKNEDVYNMSGIKKEKEIVKIK